MKINIPVFHQQPHTKRTNQINLCTNTFPYRDNTGTLYYLPGFLLVPSRHIKNIHLSAFEVKSAKVEKRLDI